MDRIPVSISFCSMTALAAFVALSAIPSTAGDIDAIYQDRACYDFILSQIYDYHLDAAESAVKDLIVKYPHDPKPYFFMTLVRWWRFVGDIYSESSRAGFLESAEKSVDIGRSKLAAGQDDIEAKFSLGGTYGYLARYYVASNSWLNAYNCGRKAKDIFSDIIQMNDTLYDAYLAIGTYNCYADKLPSLLRIIASVIGLGGDSQLGINQLRLAADSGCYARVEALSMLGYVDLELQDNYGGAIKIFAKLSTEHRSNPVFKLLLANSYRKSGEYEKAISVCLSCLSDRSARYVSHNQLAGIHAELAYCLMLARDYKGAIHQYELCCSIASETFLRESPWIYFNAGLCEESERHYAGAEAYYRKVLGCEDYFDYHSLARKSIQRVNKKTESGHSTAGAQSPQ